MADKNAIVVSTTAVDKMEWQQYQDGSRGLIDNSKILSFSEYAQIGEPNSSDSMGNYSDVQSNSLGTTIEFKELEQPHS